MTLGARLSEHLVALPPKRDSYALRGMRATGLSGVFGLGVY
jgi:hypothetical protein